MGGEPPSRVRGGAIGGSVPRGRRRSARRIEYVLRKAPCRVLLTAPPEG